MGFNSGFKGLKYYVEGEGSNMNSNWISGLGGDHKKAVAKIHGPDIDHEIS